MKCHQKGMLLNSNFALQMFEAKLQKINVFICFVINAEEYLLQLKQKKSKKIFIKNF